MTPSAEPTQPHSQDLREHRRLDSPGTWFITKNLQPRRPLLTDTGIADEIVRTFEFTVQQGRIAMAAFCVMPDHWHAVFAVRESTLPRAMQRMGTWVGRQSSEALQQAKVAWQDGYYDTRVVSSKQFAHVCRYTEDNPVRAGLVEAAEDWRWSSAHEGHAGLALRPWPWEFEKDVR